MHNDALERIIKFGNTSFIADEILSAWRSMCKPTGELSLGSSRNHLLSDKSSKTVSAEDVSNSSFDLILLDTHCADIHEPGVERVEHLSSAILKCDRLLSWHGTIIVSTQSFLVTGRSFNALDRMLRNQGFRIKSILRLPVDTNRMSASEFRPVILFVSRNTQSDFFVADIDITSDVDQVISAFLERRGSDSVKQGLLVSTNTFHSIDRLALHERAIEISKKFEDCSTCQITELITAEIRVKQGERHVQFDDAVYVSTSNAHGLLCETEAEKIAISHHFYTCLRLAKECDPEYLRYYINSIVSGSLFSYDGKSLGSQSIDGITLKSCTIALPPQSIQEDIVQTSADLHTLVNAMIDLQNDLFARPLAARGLLTKGREMLQIIGQLSAADMVRERIRDGESDMVEFKETFSWDVKKNIKADYIEHSALKTIAAFLNTRGGTLLIGVADGKAVHGIDLEVQSLYSSKGIDGMLLHIDNKIKKAFGEAVNASIIRRVVEIQGKSIISFECPRSGEPVFLDDKEFYIRKTPSSAKIEGSEMARYIKRRFHERDIQ